MQVNCQAILNDTQVDMNDMLDLHSILPHLASRGLLTQRDREYLGNSDVPTDTKILNLSTIVHKKGKNALSKLYLCLLDSWERPGLQQHYFLAHTIRKHSRLGRWVWCVVMTPSLSHTHTHTHTHIHTHLMVYTSSDQAWFQC